MAIKPLKLKRFISEEEAAQLLSLLIGEKVSNEKMAEYALEGIIPAYMHFSPVDEETYPHQFFSLADGSNFPAYDTNRGVMQEWMSVIPYPLPSDCWIDDSNGEKWRVFAGRATFEVDEVTPDHYVRVYAPPEICQAAQIMNDPTACPQWPAIVHSHGETWHYMDVDNDGKDVLSPAMHMLSPFRLVDGHSYIPSWREKLVRPRPGGIGLPETDSALNWAMVVAGLHKLLEPQWSKQGLISDEIAAFKLPGAGKTNVDQALSLANQALSDPNPKRRRRKTAN
jgi:hypothetical protein